MRRPHFEPDPAMFDADAYRVARAGAVAWHVLGWETEPDADTEWSGYETRTGRVVAVMVGDDQRHTVNIEDLAPLGELDYCASCGQIGCTHDGRDRGAA